VEVEALTTRQLVWEVLEETVVDRVEVEVVEEVVLLVVLVVRELGLRCVFYLLAEEGLVVLTWVSSTPLQIHY
jgi:hypothetical protein